MCHDTQRATPDGSTAQREIIKQFSAIDTYLFFEYLKAVSINLSLCLDLKPDVFLI